MPKHILANRPRAPSLLSGELDLSCTVSGKHALKVEMELRTLWISCGSFDVECAKDNMHLRAPTLVASTEGEKRSSSGHFFQLLSLVQPRKDSETRRNNVVAPSRRMTEQKLAQTAVVKAGVVSTNRIWNNVLRIRIRLQG